MHIRIAHRKRLHSAVAEDDIPDMDVNDDPLVEEPVDVVCDTNFIFQTQIIKKVSYYSEDSVMPKVKKNDGSFGSNHRWVSMLILMYVASRPHISEDEDATCNRADFLD